MKALLFCLLFSVFCPLVAHAQSAVGDLLVGRTIKLGTYVAGTITPAQITANQNNYAPTGYATAFRFRLTTDASRNLTGLVPPSSPGGTLVSIENVGSFNLVLIDDSASSTAANRFDLAGDYTLTPGTAALFLYDATSSRWRHLGLQSASLGSGFQPADVDLDYLAGFTPTANIKSILNAADYAAVRSLLSLGVTSITAEAANVFTPTLRTSGVASYFTLTIPADTGITASTESIGFNLATNSRAWATTGTVTLQRERFFAGPTYTSAAASQTFTDVFNLYLTPPIAGTNVIFTRPHTFGIVDSTSASSPITGGFIVAAAVGTTATSVGIGGGNVYAGGTIRSISPTAGLGYSTGAGGTITQATSKSTGVTLNTVTGEITLNNASLAADTTVSFVLTNSAIAATDVVILNHVTTGTFGAYQLNAHGAGAGTITIDVRNITAGSLGEAIVIRFAVIKAATS